MRILCFQLKHCHLAVRRMLVLIQVAVLTHRQTSIRLLIYTENIERNKSAEKAKNKQQKTVGKVKIVRQAEMKSCGKSVRARPLANWTFYPHGGFSFPACHIILFVYFRPFAFLVCLLKISKPEKYLHV